MLQIILTVVQLGPQLLDFFLELTQEGILGVFVDSGVVFNRLGAVRISQGANGLIVVIVGGANVCDLRKARRKGYF